ncbi:MAG: sulfotransferase domain-containing protein [Chloroflexi bacterium]|nr:sulfotransferase domain-containing protein [Chloroflexota bacterium]
MQRKLQRKFQIVAMELFMGMGRLLAALGKSEQIMRFVGRHVNAPRWKTRPFAYYTPTSHDIFVATFAKSGTNWMMQIAQQIAYYGAAEFEHIHDLVPWPDVPLPVIIARLDDPTIVQQAPTGLRIIKTHNEQEYVPFNAQAKYICVIRDPQEMIVSSYYFAKGVFDPMGVTYDFEQWLVLALQSDDFFFGDWAAHTASWWALRHEPNVFVLTYNELKRDTAVNIEQIANFMDVSLNSEQLATVIKRSSFAWMKAHESQFKPPMPPQRGNNNGPLMMRSGQSGQSSELLSVEQQTAVNQHFRTKLKQLNSDFPYNELFGE